jgi:GNAT superfamily N-acetyltransferase
LEAYLIRGYRPEDRSRVREICLQTGFLGKPQDPWIQGSVLAEIFTRYYTDYEPGSAFVVEVDGHVEGYLLGCRDSYREKRIFRRKILPGLVLSMLRPAWWGRPVNRRWLRAMARSTLQGEMRFPEKEIFSSYPAHLHTNIVDPGLRGQGIGRALMQRYFDMLRGNRVPGVHLATTSHNRRAVRFYRAVGFEVLHENRLTCYDHVIDDPPLKMLYMGKRL